MYKLLVSRSHTKLRSVSSRMARVIRPIRLPGIAAEENLFQCYRYWPRANSLRPEKEKGIRKSFYVSLFLFLSLREGAARWHEILLKDVDNHEKREFRHEVNEFSAG